MAFVKLLYARLRRCVCVCVCVRIRTHTYTYMRTVSEVYIDILYPHILS